ncbi:hypothetical protein Pmar_PMAR005107 [Perkinsus marinus ATCC 50983]|uniref:Uncharacterized protein n=1 Tax=Perkinsus marinus (strain ATCC 50983 / TXsc) TaxID=423536 RepID=C5KAM6_PERM5|nr:hypothetical protein Pmar_PMAR005107 [Perkinsus marinus ATCC 50983]EER18202.1 hypothetical protein Pmar_PMAR005107 [Perkinsus marinus ATCC 50983]|eukprot:XP_002786406.1 hypothetical protein Pmar_PMAR005107 [Perkinsus marinus ATCC 50983]
MLFRASPLQAEPGAPTNAEVVVVDIDYDGMTTSDTLTLTRALNLMDERVKHLTSKEGHSKGVADDADVVAQPRDVTLTEDEHPTLTVQDKARNATPSALEKAVESACPNILQDHPCATMEAVLNQVENQEEVGMDTECDEKLIGDEPEKAEQNHHVVTNDVVVRRWDAQIEDRPAASPTPLSLRKVSNAFQNTMEYGAFIGGYSYESIPNSMTTDDLIAIGPWVHVHKVHTGMDSAMTQDHGVDVDPTQGDVPPSKEDEGEVMLPPVHPNYDDGVNIDYDRVPYADAQTLLRVLTLMDEKVKYLTNRDDTARVSDGGQAIPSGSVPAMEETTPTIENELQVGPGKIPKGFSVIAEVSTQADGASRIQAG